MKNRNKIPVTYLCWGCGSSLTRYERVKSQLPLPALEVWNLCPSCILRDGVKDKVIAKNIK